MLAKLSNILVGADQEYLRRESERLHSDNDLHNFLLRVFARGYYPRQELPGTCENQLAPNWERYDLLSELLPDATPQFLKLNAARLPSLASVREFAQHTSSYPKKRVFRKISNEFQDPKLITLMEMLPDASPEYLKKELKNLKTDQEMEEFIVSAIDTKDYPKLEAYRKNQEYKKQWKKYLEEFKVEEYLQLFPDPINYFYFTKVGKKDVPMKFLQLRYRLRNSYYFKSVYERVKNNLTRTCDQLDMMSASPFKLSKWDYKSPTFDIIVLQEIAFIQNKQAIAQYLFASKEKKAAAYYEAKLNGTWMECGCCGDECVSEDIGTCKEGHIFCRPCIKRGSEVLIGNGKTKFPCYNGDCKEEFCLEVLKDVLHPDAFSRLQMRQQYEEVQAAGIPGLESCPFCEFCSIPAAEDKVFSCLNPACMKITCRKCKKTEHLPFTCEEIKKRAETKEKMKQFVEEKMTEALVRTCYQCSAKFIKDDGCNLMYCQCGAKMCYVCYQPVKDYNHFKNSKCQLWMDINVLHVQNVVARGKKAKQDIEAANPGISVQNDHLFK